MELLLKSNARRSFKNYVECGIPTKDRELIALRTNLLETIEKTWGEACVEKTILAKKKYYILLTLEKQMLGIVSQPGVSLVLQNSVERLECAFWKDFIAITKVL